MVTTSYTQNQPDYQIVYQTARAEASVRSVTEPERPTRVTRTARTTQPKVDTEPMSEPAVTAPAEAKPKATKVEIIEAATPVSDEPKLKLQPEPETVSEKQATDFETVVVLEIHRLTNEARKKRKLTPLTLSPQLSETAEYKATDMIKRDYFAHANPNGCDYTCVLETFDFKALAWGENLFQYTSTNPPEADELAEIIVTQWLKSSGHRENILNPDYTHEGISLVKSGKTFYAVTHFAKPK